MKKLPRREFLRLAGATTLAGTFPYRFSISDPLVPDNWSNPEMAQTWLKHLFERGEPSEYRGEELRYIGMPVGGICAGMVYLGGDGKLWLWDIFNANHAGVSPQKVEFRGKSIDDQSGAAYIKPLNQVSPFEHGFTLKVDGLSFPLDASGWEEIRFVGKYPVGRVSYADPKTAITVDLTAFSPFIPLNEDDSGLPITLMTYRVHNGETAVKEIELSGHLANPVGLNGGIEYGLKRSNHIDSSPELTAVGFTAFIPAENEPVRSDIPFETWSSDTYVGWTVEGTAFGIGPLKRSQIPSYQGDVGGPGDRVVNSHASAPGSTVAEKDAAKGRLISHEFKIERRFLNFWIGGGNHVGQTCLNLIIDGKMVRTATGRDSNAMAPASFDLNGLAGKTAHLEIVDDYSGAWGNIGVGPIIQSDRQANEIPLDKRPDFGDMTLAVFAEGKADAGGEEKPGTVTYSKKLKPGESTTITFAISWYFPNLKLGIPDDSSKRYYSKRFRNSGEVIDYVFNNRDRLIKDTLAWEQNWNDSTLPHWFLDRTFVNTAVLATTTCHRFGTGRFYAWEGIGCCVGTCTHVWHYAQAVGRLFPKLERDTRERVDYGISFHPDTGGIAVRAEFVREPAVDGQAGTILRTLREHQMSPDDGFLRRVWPKTKLAIGYLRHMDRGDGLLTGAQDNTLDAAWYGESPWISSLYLAALRAGEVMALEMGDQAFADSCRQRWEMGRTSMETKLYNGSYFFQIKDPKHAENLGTYDGCHIDQVHGQSWAWQVGIGRILDKEKTISALKALYKNNFLPDVGPFRDANKEGRWYALPGDAGLIMASNPVGEVNPFGDGQAWQFGYFNECMTGFEHQAASHMVAEGLVDEGFAVTRAIHERYEAKFRNPYNEIECSDHYARSMASYGTFITACGFEYDGPKAHIAFAPRVTPDNFKAAFTGAEGWGSFSQTRKGAVQSNTILVRWGRLRLRTIGIVLPDGNTRKLTVKFDRKSVSASVSMSENRALITFDEPVVINTSQTLKLDFAST